MESIFIGLVILFLAVLVVSDKARILLRGFIGIFIKDFARTPEMVKATYERAISKAQINYNRTHDTVSDLSGKQHITSKEKEELQAKLKNCEQKCERAAQDNRIDDLVLFAEEREFLLANINLKEEMLAKLEPLVTSAQEALNYCEKELQRLKSKRDMDVSTLETNLRMKEALDKMDGLKKTTATDRLLADAEESVKQSEARLAGARMMHESKLSTKLQRAEDRDQAARHQEYVDSLLNKYQKKED